MPSTGSFFEGFTGTGALPSTFQTFRSPTTADCLSNQLRLASLNADYSGVQTVTSTYDLTDSTCVFKIDTTSPGELYLALTSGAVLEPAMLWRGFDYLPGRIVSSNPGNFGLITGNGALKPWVRFRHSTANDAIYWETSSDGNTWDSPFATLSSASTSGYVWTSCRISILTGSAAGNGTLFYVDQVGTATSSAAFLGINNGMIY